MTDNNIDPHNPKPLRELTQVEKQLLKLMGRTRMEHIDDRGRITTRIILHDGRVAQLHWKTREFLDRFKDPQKQLDKELARVDREVRREQQRRHREIHRGLGRGLERER